MTRFSLDDLYQIDSVSSPAVSPSGDRVAFVVSGFRKEENDKYQNLWIALTDGGAQPHRLTRGDTNDSSPAWSPDGRYLAFLSRRADEIEVAAKDVDEDESDSSNTEPKPQIWIMDLKMGGEPRQLTSRPEGVKEFDWSPDGSQIAFASRDPSEDQKDYLASVRGEGEKEDKGPVVIRRTQHKRDGQGYLDEVRTHLFCADVGSREVRRLTDGPCDETSPRWSPDGKWVLFVSNRTGDADNNRRADLWLISCCGEQVRRLTFGDLNVSTPSWSADSQHVAFVSSPEPENAYRQNNLMVVDVSDAEPVCDLTDCVGEGWSSLGGVVPDGAADDPAEAARVYPVPRRSSDAAVLTADLDRPVIGMSRPVWCGSEEILALAADRGQTRILRVSLDGETSWLYPQDEDRGCSVSFAGISGGEGGIAFGLDRPQTSTDLYYLPLTGGAEPIRLTSLNRKLLSQRSTAGYRRVTFDNSDGQQVEGLVAVPDGFSEGDSPCPLIVKIHGGPMSYDSPGFRFDVQYWASMGYMVLMVNYRGSISYGEDFSAVIRGRWGPREHDDVLSGVDALLQRGWADPDRLYCTGFSQGGIMTNWAVGHTDRFRAAASEHGMWDYVAAFGTDDCHLWWQDDLGVPWHNEEGYRQMSPSSAAADIQTPLLITAGEVDWRCPLSQSEQLYMSLKKRGIPTELVIYQGENHAISKPKRATDRISRISRWFAEYGGIDPQAADDEQYPDPQ